MPQCGGVVACPDGLDTAKEIIAVHGEIQELKNCVAALGKGIDALDEKLIKLLDGYDFE